MKRIETDLPGVCLLEPDLFGDARGFFFESYHQAKFAEIGIRDTFVQDGHSRSVKGTLRGLHYQLGFPQSKLCRVITGEVLDVAVDIRRGSPTFGKWVKVILSAENRRMIYIPREFAHGFLVLSEVADFLYKVDDFYHPEDDRGIAWNDPDLGIDWDLSRWGIAAPALSPKDQDLPRLAALPSDRLPRYRER